MTRPPVAATPGASRTTRTSSRSHLAVVPDDATAAVRTPEPHPDVALVDAVLGPDGLAGAPGVGRDDLTDAAAELVRRLIGVDDCWVQPPGDYAEELLQGASGTPRRSLSNVLSGQAGLSDPTGGGRSLIALGVAEVEVCGRSHVLVAWSRGPRAWSTRDRDVLVRVARALTEALAGLAAGPSPTQWARGQFAELKRDLLVTVNHELRTPLTVLNSALELLTEELADDPRSALVTRMRRNLTRLLDLADNVNLLAQGLPDQLLRDQAQTEVSEVVAGVAALVPADRAVIVTQDEGARARIDRDDLREMLERVVGNAVKFTDPGAQLEIDVSTPEGREVVDLRVRDTGIGIPESEQHRLGEPFFRSSHAQRLERQGAGLGLAAVMAIATRWQGTVVIDSGAEGGTEVRISLPRATPRQRREASIL